MVCMALYDEIVNLALRRSLFFPTNEIYANAPAGFYDYGPYGATIKRKIVELWRKELVQKEGMMEIDGSIAMTEDVFKSSGHLASFSDPMTQCKKCNLLHRADKLLTEKTKKEFKEAMPDKELTEAIQKYKIVCTSCKGELMPVKRLNMMVKGEIGVATKAPCYLRPETCQSIFVDFARLAKTMRMKLPQGIAQAGTVFRNEISPRQSLLRQVEFQQMEAEVFFDPDKIDLIEEFNEVAKYKISVMKVGTKKNELVSCEELVKKKIVSGKLIAYYMARTQQLYEKYGFKVENMRFRELDDDERAFYAKEGWDFEVNTSVGWLELIANNYRTDYDLKKHGEGSGQDTTYLDETGKKFIPHVWEISIGIGRTMYAILENSFTKEKDRVFLSLPAQIAPLQAAVFPLLSNKPELVRKAKQISDELKCCYEVFYDESGSIGKRYARMDEIGCPCCITIDFDSLKNNDVTIRDRDSSKQKRVSVEELREVLFKVVTGVEFDKV